MRRPRSREVIIPTVIAGLAASSFLVKHAIEAANKPTACDTMAASKSYSVGRKPTELDCETKAFGVAIDDAYKDPGSITRYGEASDPDNPTVMDKTESIMVGGTVLTVYKRQIGSVAIIPEIDVKTIDGNDFNDRPIKSVSLQADYKNPFDITWNGHSNTEPKGVNDAIDPPAFSNLLYEAEGMGMDAGFTAGLEQFLTVA